VVAAVAAVFLVVEAEILVKLVATNVLVAAAARGFTVTAVIQLTQAEVVHLQEVVVVVVDFMVVAET
jgi:hypothetical protein